MGQITTGTIVETAAGCIVMTPEMDAELKDGRGEAGNDE